VLALKIGLSLKLKYLLALIFKYLIKAEQSIKPDAQETAWLLFIN
jgi:hypothetical protein